MIPSRINHQHKMTPNLSESSVAMNGWAECSNIITAKQHEEDCWTYWTRANGPCQFTKSYLLL